MPDVTSSYDVVVIGAGVAGLAAAAVAASRGVAVACVERALPGGLILNVNELKPGIPDRPESGSELAAELMSEASAAGVVQLSGEAGAIATTPSGLVVRCGDEEHRARALVLASGARIRPLGAPGEIELEHRGVTRCADCDGPFYRGKDVVVVGGGDSAVQEALVLAGCCRSVSLIYRSSRLSARAELVAALERCPNVTELADASVERIEGGDAVTAVIVRAHGSATDRRLQCSAVFPFVGLAPNAEFLPGEVPRDAAGRIVADDAMATSLPGLFAAGAVRAGCGGTLVDALADGRKAGESAARFARREVAAASTHAD